MFIYRKSDKNDKETILVVRTDAIGDFVLWLEAAKEYTTVFPKERYRLVLLGNELWTEIAKEVLEFDEIWPVSRIKLKRDLRYRFKTIKKIRNGNFDKVIYPTYSRELILGDCIVRASGATERIGSAGDSSNQAEFKKNISDRWYTRLILSTFAPLMELERNTEFMHGLGSKMHISLPVLRTKAYTPEEIINLTDYYVIFPGASWTGRQWPVMNFSEIAERIYATTGWTGIICGGQHEVELGEILKNNSKAPLCSLIGKTSILELITTISKANLVLTNDTSAVHFSAALSVPSICIVGGGHFGRFVPYSVSLNQCFTPRAVNYQMSCYNCNWNCIYNTGEGEAVPCISNVSIESVWNETRRVIERRVYAESANN